MLQGYSTFGPYEEWVRFVPFCYVLIVAFTLGLSFSVLSLISMIVTSVFPNRYVAVGVPVLVVEFLYGCGELLPPHLDFFQVSNGFRLFLGKGPIIHLIYTVFYFCTLYAVLSAVFVGRVEKT